MKVNWKKEDEEYLIDNYNNKTNEELAKILNRTISAVRNKSQSLRLYKNKDFTCKIRKKRMDVNITKEILIELYYKEKISIRRIAQQLNVGKTTIEHYFKKYNIKRRTHSEANKERFKWDIPWFKNAPKSIFKKGAKKCAETLLKNKKIKIKLFEEKNKITIKEFLEESYINKEMNLSEIGKIIGFGKVTISKLLSEYNIPKHSNFEKLASIKREDRYQYGKTWEELFGKEKAIIKKKIASLRLRKLIIKRLQNNEMPFSNTKIELMIKQELNNRNIYFKFQQPMYNRFVCDFVLPQYKIVLECDGDYWHANPKIYDRNSPNLSKIQTDHIKRDKIKDEYLTKNGWVVVRFFESEIKENVLKCINELFDIINNNSKGDYIMFKTEGIFQKGLEVNKEVIGNMHKNDH